MKKYIIVLVTMIGFAVSSFAQEPIVLKGKELFGSMRARHIGPNIGRITDIVGHPTNSKVIYIGTAGGGVWKSVNGAIGFNPIFDDHNQSIGTVAIDPNKPDHVIWVGTGETWTRNSISPGDGLYKSTDGGNNWKKMGFEESDHISSIQINPNNSDEVYVGILGPLWGDHPDRGVYKTSDGGITWEQLLPGNLSTGCSDLIMDPNNPNVLYAAFWEFRRTAWSFNSGGEHSALYKSVDGGKSWNKIHNGFPEGVFGRFALAVAPNNSNIVYAVIESENKSKCGLYRSENAGESWTHQNKDFGLAVRPFYFSRIVVDPKNSDIVAKCGLSGMISRDGGKTFRNVGVQHGDVHDFWFDINNSDMIYSVDDGGVYRSFDGGSTFDMVNDLPIAQFYHVSVDNAEPYNVYGGLQDNGSWYGPSSKAGGIKMDDWTCVGIGDGFRVYPHPTKNILYSEMQGAMSIWRIDVDKNEIISIQPFPEKGDPKFRYNWNTAIQISPNKPDRVYVGNQFLFRSEDMGDNWERISPDLTTNDPAKQQQGNSGGLSLDNTGAENNTTIFTIAESPLNENIIWVGTDDGNVQVTMDGGKNWSNVIANIPDLPAHTWCYHIEASHFHEGAAYVVFDGHTANDDNTYVFKTTDFGKTWKSIANNDIVGFARHILEDYEKEDLLFLGTELGLYISINGGKNWTKFTNNMPSAPVHYMAMQKKTNDLVMGTHGRGIIIIDDISPLRKINQDVLQKKVHLFETEPTIIWEQNSFNRTVSPTQFTGENPDHSAKIIYYLKKRHTFGKMTMEIFNDKDELVAKLGPGKQKGLNIVNWNYVKQPPKIAKGKTFSIMALMSTELLPAGRYKIVLKKGREIYESHIDLIYDPNSKITLEARKLKLELSDKLYDLTQQLAYMVHEMDEIMAYVNTIKKDYPKIQKVSDQLIKEIESLKETVVVMSGDNYVGSSEPQLREEISNLYSVIGSWLGKPSNLHYKNYDLLKEQFDEAKANFENIKAKQLKKVEKFALKNELKAREIESFEEFVK